MTSKPNTAEAALGTASETTLTMTTSQDSASVALNPVGENGSFAASTIAESAAFSVTSNNITGYTLTMSNSSSTGELVSSTDSLASISSITSLTDFSADTAAAASNYNGKWGYLPSKYNGTSNTTNYYPAPISTDPTPATLDTTNAPNSTANEYTIGIGARADMNKAAGAYTGTFVLQAIGNIVPYVITYADNSGDSTVTGAPINPSTPTTGNIEGGTPSGESITTLATSIPTRTGYTFKSWCDGIVSSNGTVCTGTEYSSGANFPIDQTVQNITTLYAVWTLNTYTITISNSNTTSGADSITVPYGGSNTVTVAPATGYYLSAVSCPSGYTCSGYSTGSSYTGQQTVTITNNNTTSGGTLSFTGALAAIAFQDATISDCGKNMYDNRGTDAYKSIIYTTAKIGDLCYMTRNLDLPGGTTLTSSDSNVTSNYTLPASSTSGFLDYSTAYVYNSGSTSCGEESPCYSYYSYTAVTAGMGASISSGEPASDICPKGWRLPTEAEYDTLIGTYTTGATLTASPFLGVYAGYYSNSSFVYSDPHYDYGRYWPSTAYSSTDAYYMYFSYSGDPSYGSRSDVIPGDKRLGYSVRCVLETRTLYEKLQAGALTMQSIGNLSSDEKSTLVSQMSANTRYNTADIRDGNSYTISKIDDKVWMTKNLDLAGGTTITPDDSNVVSNYTLPASSTTGFSNDSTAYVYNSGSTTCGHNSPCYSYYSYTAVTAGANPSSGEATSDICPKGWRLPTSAEYDTLIGTYTTGATLTASPFLGVYAGLYSNSSFSDGGSYGRYWSSTAYSSTSTYSLYFGRSGSARNAVVRSLSKRLGYSVRCVLQ